MRKRIRIDKPDWQCEPASGTHICEIEPQAAGGRKDGNKKWFKIQQQIAE